MTNKSQTKSLLTCALFSIAVTSMTAIATTAAHADGYCGSQKTYFSCKTTNNKLLKVCQSGRQFIYSYGREGKKPDLRLVRDANNTPVTTWNGVGSTMDQSIQFNNGKTSYTVFSSYERGANGSESGGVLVEKNGRTLATVKCYPNTMIDNLPQ